MAETLNARVKEYFARDDAAAHWWNVDHTSGGRYARQARFLTEHVPLAGKRCLDVATGRGRFAIAFAQGGAAAVIGVDIAPAMIEHAKKNAASAGVADRITWVVSPADSFPVEGEFDVASIMEALPHIPEPERVIAEVARRIRPGGFFVTSYDYTWAPRVTYPIDAVHSAVKRAIGREGQVMAATVDETMDLLEKGEKKSKTVTRPRDAYRGIPRRLIEDALRAANLFPVARMQEYTQLLKVPFPVPIGEMLIAIKS